MTDILVRSGRIALLDIHGLIDENIEIFDNSEFLRTQPALSIVGVAQDKQEDFLHSRPTEMTLKIDATHCDKDYVIYAVICNNVHMKISNIRFEQVAPSKHQAAVDLDMLSGAIATHQQAMPEAASQNAGFEVVYYPVKVLDRLHAINADTLKSVTSSKRLTVVFPKSKAFGTLDFDQFGMVYDELTNIHVVKTVFEQTFGELAKAPQRHDILFIPFANQFFEVSNVDYTKSVDNRVIFYDLTLSVFTDRESVEKQDDILDVSDMLSMFESEDISPETAEPLERSGLLAKREETKYGLQILHETELIDLDDFQDSWIYAIAWSAGAWWLVEIADDNVTKRFWNLKRNAVAAVDSSSDLTSDRLNVAKMVVLNKPLDDVQKNMYFTSVSLPPNIRPLYTVNHVHHKQF